MERVCCYTPLAVTAVTITLGHRYAAAFTWHKLLQVYEGAIRIVSNSSPLQIPKSNLRFSPATRWDLNRAKCTLARLHTILEAYDPEGPTLLFLLRVEIIIRSNLQSLRLPQQASFHDHKYSA